MRGKKYVLAVLVAALLCFACAGKAEAASRYTIYVNRKTNLVNVVDSRSGKLVRAMYCSTGKKYSTIRGTYSTVSKMRWHALYGGVYGQYCTRIHGPYLFHSVYYYKTRKNQMAVGEYNKLGSQASAGCVRLAVADAKWIYDNCGIGTKVVIGESRELEEPSQEKLKIDTSRRTGWDPTDPDAANPYHPTIALKKSASVKLDYGSRVTKKSLKELIKVKSPVTSSSDLLDNVKVKGKVNTSKAGKYKIVYTVTDPKTFLTKSLAVEFRVKREPDKEEIPLAQPGEEQASVTVVQ
ncbi:MAG: L,D-transpeptidase family protein [Eubacteriales bacterium]|nr:L,D-transpeptidase family protein [Eubacteriales bacterium]